MYCIIMCGRFTLKSSYETLQDNFELETGLCLKPRFNIAPSQLIPIIRELGSIEFLNWGLQPTWLLEKDPKHAGFINARIETVEEKPSFKGAFQKRRCAVVCDGYFEWRKMGQTKQPYYIRRSTNEPFLLAGIWENETCAILTRQAAPALETIHERMPVILDRENLTSWLTSKKIEPFQEELVFFPVSSRLNDPSYDSPLCVERL